MSDVPDEPATPRQTEDPPRVPPPDQPRVEPWPPDGEGGDAEADSDSCEDEER